MNFFRKSCSPDGTEWNPGFLIYEAPKQALNQMTKDKREYELLLSQVAGWKPTSSVPPPERLYEDLKKLTDRLTRASAPLGNWAVNLEGFFLLKSGFSFRNLRSERLGLLRSIAEEHSEHAIVARWILARIEVGEITADNPDAHVHLKRALTWVENITAPVKELKVDILLPGIRSETGHPVDDEGIWDSGDPPIHFIPVPYRYQIAYAMNLAALTRNTALLDYGLKRYEDATNPRDIFDADSQYALNLESIRLVIQSMKEGISPKSTNPTVTIDQSWEFNERIENAQKQGILRPQKAYEWLTASFSVIASLTDGSAHEAALAKLWDYAEKTMEANNGRGDFFAIDRIYKNAHKNEEEHRWFLSIIAPARIITMRNEYDVFICHASEDKATVARPLNDALKLRKKTVWFDEGELRLGNIVFLNHL